MAIVNTNAQQTLTYSRLPHEDVAVSSLFESKGTIFRVILNMPNVRIQPCLDPVLVLDI